jgi:hypothetical protein
VSRLLAYRRIAMTKEEREIFDDIGARLGALEFIARQLLSIHIREEEGDPLESASRLQASAATGLRAKLDDFAEGNEKERMRKQTIHVLRIYEDLIRGYEEDDRSG